MFVKNVTINEEVEQLNRNQHIEIRCELPLNGNYRVISLREVVCVKNGERVRVPEEYEYVYPVERSLADIQSDQVTLPAEFGGITLTVAQVAKALEMLTDVYAEEDDPHPSSSSSA